jgi:hypothetical protein
LVLLLPSRYTYGPTWFPYVTVGVVVASMLTVTFIPTSVLWHRVERAIVLTIFTIVCGMNILAVFRLVVDMINHRHGYAATTLLESAAVIWTLNVLLFALLYWQLDRAGPEARAAGVAGIADFHFAETQVEERSPDWTPIFVDYLYLAFATSTAFSPPDYARPSSRRAKLLLMFQASISLTTLVLIASRAVSSLS